MAPEMIPPEPLPTDLRAVAAAANRIKDATSDDLGKTEDGESITGWLFHDQANWSGSKYAAMSQSYRDGGLGWALLWDNEDGELEVFGGTYRLPPLQSNPDVWAFRVVGTDIPDVEGVTRSHRSIENHGLGAEWQGFEATSTYEGGGTLALRLFTDLQESDNPGNPFVGDFIGDASYHNIALTDSRIPAIPVDQDGINIGVPEGGLRGSLGGEAGTFTCATGSYCFLSTQRSQLAPGYTPHVQSDPVVFTPDDGGAAVELTAARLQSVTATNYLNFGYWLFVPEDVTAASAFDFGVFAGGDDPFLVNNLQGLAEIAEYEGEAAGVYAETTMISHFNAKVALTADFGTVDNFGSIVGRVYDFNIDGGTTSPLTELSLQSVSWRDTEGTTNIFQSVVEGGWPFPGGYNHGKTAADGDWQGRWGGKFFGNGSTAADHPTSFAGTFGATDGNRSFAGSFGAER